MHIQSIGMKVKMVYLMFCYLQEYSGQLEARENQLQEIITSCKTVEQTTSEAGIVILTQEINSVTNRWKSFSNLIEKSSQDLQHLLQQWNEMETHIADFSKWIKECDASLKQCELKSFLDEKRSQLNRLKVCFDSYFKYIIVGLLLVRTKYICCF